MECRFSPIIVAAMADDVSMLRYLGKELGADVNNAMEIGTTALMVAAEYGHVDSVRCLGMELGADVEQARLDGCTILSQAAVFDHLDVVQCLVKELGASVNEANSRRAKPLFAAAHQGKLGVVHWLLAEGGASLHTQRYRGNTLWNYLKLDNADDAKLTSLLQTMVILADAPPKFIAKLSQQQVDLCMRGRELRTQLPAYVEQLRASIIAHCPLPEVLHPVVAEYAAPTSVDMWTDGLRVSTTE
jgi:hypothetical protein